MSPSGNYLAYIDSEGKLNLFARAGGWHRVWDVKLSEDFSDIRFNSAENLLLLNVYYSHFKVISVSDPSHIVYQNIEGQGAPGVWGYGNQVFYLNRNEENLNIVDIDTMSIARREIWFSPENFDRVNNTLSSHSYSESIGWYMSRLNLDSLEQIVTTFSYAPYESDDFIGKALSPDGKRVVMTYGKSIDPAGIFVLTVTSDSTEVVRIR